ncbi:DUF2785 domain-containing protein [Nocardioides sp.]|uniref:DUF2785 domain-containing protein n=1 Tax=Nocardioides sp. TaxID=35761 RepID=UPI00239302CA|nr:DUF2785 domain-containing protein [Nocardioides sp.]MDE0776103.1 DUF2785 domain-containing protein [Nocardioides sp.]
MTRVNWKAVLDDDFQVPDHTPLGDLTTELTELLGSPDADLRDRLAYPTLATWIERGVYDDLLPGLGDGMVAGLRVGLGEPEGDDVFRRSFSALVLAECIARDNSRPLVLGGKVLQWGDALATWLLRERDLRGFVPGKGWAHSIAHGADALGVLARSPHLAAAELTVLLDVIVDRLVLPVESPFQHGEDDRLAAATIAVLRRDCVPMTVLEPWINRIAAAATAPRASSADPYLATGNAQGFLRSLYLGLALGARPPAIRADLMLVLVGALRGTNVVLRDG